MSILVSALLPLLKKCFKGNPSEISPSPSFLSIHIPKADRSSSTDSYFHTDTVEHLWVTAQFKLYIDAKGFSSRCNSSPQKTTMTNGASIPSSHPVSGSCTFLTRTLPNSQSRRDRSKQNKTRRGVHHGRTNSTPAVCQHILSAAALTPQMQSLNNLLLCSQPAPLL